ncbi:ash family protein [Avibacterium avium]|uniref:ash family protein n=1 Tax=Avibacterium avium TaxID=751 RepID=UPI001FE66333|nr:ash family protein [Avibacterium avium]
MTNDQASNYAFPAFAKSKASREKLNNLLQANSTPTRAFFVRNFRTPKERQFKACSSMVERNRHALSVAAYPVGAVSHPVTFYRPTVRSLAVVFEKFTIGLSAMIYKFQLVGSRLHVSTYAKSEAHARQFLNLTPQEAICFARIKGGRYA